MNDEITNKDPTNKYGKNISGSESSPSPIEGKMDSAMKGQHTDSLINDAPIRAQTNEIHKDSTANTPKGNSLPNTEKPVFTGSRNEVFGKESVKKVSYLVG